MPFVIRSRRVFTPDGERPAAVEVEDGRIRAIVPLEHASARAPGDLDLGELPLLPGVVDSHVHVNEPGRTDWEGFASATRAAAAGGITTLCDMPLNSSPCTTTAAALAAKAAAAADQALVDYALWGGVVPGNTHELAGLIDAGVPGFKCFLVHSGIDEFPDVGERELALAMPVLAARGVPLIVHAELPGPIDTATSAQAALGPPDPRRYASWLESRPQAAEVEAVRLLLRLAEATGCRVHIVHLSAADALPLLGDARARGVPLSAETCPHYLTFTAEEIPDGATAYKCAPPIRERENRERLWAGLRAGLIDQIVSDHSPCPGHMKHLEAGDFLAAWGGIASVELTLPAVWTEARTRGFTLADLVRLMCAAPARLARLPGKGAIVAGADADLVVFDPDTRWRVEPARLHHRHPITPYAGRELTGKVVTTIARGEIVYDGGQLMARAAGHRVIC